jgi:predicted esterase
VSFPAVVVVGFHGYAQSAEDMMVILEALPLNGDRTLVSVQALHRFYTRGDQNIVASWMTRQDREQAIPDNVAYVDAVLDRVAPLAGNKNETGTRFQETSPGLVFMGFSQGTAMAYRAGLLGRRRAAGIIAIGGDIPPDVKSVAADRWPRVLIAGGEKDQWFTPEKVAADHAFLNERGISHDVFRYPAGHEVTDDVRARVATFIESLP